VSSESTSKHPVEDVWQYPRPPRLESTDEHIIVRWKGEIVAETRRALRLLETSHPPTYYIPREDVRADWIVEAKHSSFCEYKGRASYWTLRKGDAESPNAAWSYANPTPKYAALKDHLAFYASRVDECSVDGEVVQAQPGDFYGGWITSRIKGPFKGGPGTWGW
jgi:uncharacterized protein (DUF427 family)